MNPVFFTIVTASYLPRARVLAESLLRQHAGAQFYVVLADRREEDHAAYAAQAGIKLVYLDELALPAPQRFLFRYSVLELCTAIKPYSFAWLFANTGAQQVVYLDPDIYVLAPLASVLQAFADGAMAVLTPHLCAPLPDDGKEPDERGMLRAGAYNLGFLGLARRGDCAPLIDWWSRRLEHYAIIDMAQGLFTDQKWMDLAPGMFSDVCVLRDTTLNLAYWNLPQREVGFEAGRWMVDGRPLAFVHFSGLDPRRPELFSFHQTRYTRENCGAIGPLVDEYLRALRDAGDPAWHKRPYAWGHLHDGTPIAPVMRAVFRRLWDEEGRGDPFAMPAADFGARTACVLHYPPQEISHVMYDAWAGDASVNTAFELRTEAGQADFLEWFAERAGKVLGLPAVLVPPVSRVPAEPVAAPAAVALLAPAPVAALVPAPRLGRRMYRGVHAAYLALPVSVRNAVRRYRPEFLRGLVRRHMMPAVFEAEYHLPPPASGAVHGAAAVTPLGELPRAQRRKARGKGGAGVAGAASPNGVTVVGYLGYALGLGEAGRAMARACVAGGVEIDIRAVQLPHRHLDSGDLLAQYPPLPVPRDTVLFCLNADSMPLLPAGLRRAELPGRYRIASWYWELEEFPQAWMGAFGEVDELWAGSPYIQTLLAAVSPVPVLYMPPPVQFTLTRDWRRADFGFPEGPCLFLFSYDFDSFVARKNPRACIDAFRQAFAKQRGDVALVIKMLHAQRHPEALAGLRELQRADPRIHLLDAAMSRDEVYGLISVCDVYLSLHRAEGFGLGMAEAMHLGKPVVATGYSGNLAFMQADNACLVQYRMVPVGEGEYPHGAGQRWAEPDTAHAAHWMRELADDPALRARIGARAASTIAERFSEQHVGEMIRRRLELIAARQGKAQRQAGR